MGADVEGEGLGCVVGEHQKRALGGEGEGRGDLGALGDLALDGICAQMAEGTRKSQSVLSDLESELSKERCDVDGLFGGVGMLECVESRGGMCSKPVGGGDGGVLGQGQRQAPQKGLVFREIALEIEVRTCGEVDAKEFEGDRAAIEGVEGDLEGGAWDGGRRVGSGIEVKSKASGEGGAEGESAFLEQEIVGEVGMLCEG